MPKEILDFYLLLIVVLHLDSNFRLVLLLRYVLKGSILFYLF